MATINAHEYSSITDINRAIRTLARSGDEIVIENPDARHQLCVGLLETAKVRIKGSAGYFCGGLSDLTDIEIENNTGWGVGDNMLSGTIVVGQNASAIAGVGLRGGTIVIRGNMGSRAGQVMKKGTILCGGNANFMAGYMMMGGRIVICGDSGSSVGQNMVTGAIYVGGKIESLGADAEFGRIEPEEEAEIRALLTQFKLPQPSAFQKVVSASKQLHYATYERGEGPAGSQPPVRKSPKYGEKSLWNKRTVEDITTKSELGRYRVRGYGAFRELPTFDDIGFRFDSGAVAGLRDVRERCKLATKIGGKFGGKPLSLSMPVLIAPMSYGALSTHCKIALARASSMVGIATNTGEGGMLGPERDAADQMIYQCLSGRFGFDPRDMQRADAIEIYISQGAKPGLGGQLMGSKITPELAAIRGIPVGMDLRSPSRHPDVMGADDLVIKIDEFREATDWRVPISLKIGAGRLKDDIKIALKDNVDFVEIDGMQGGTGASSEVVTENVGIPTLAAIVQAIRGLKEIDQDGQLQIVLMGGIRSGIDAAKAIALGSDAVAIGTSALIAMGCISCMRCHIGNCVRGIATQKQDLVDRLDVDSAAQRVANLLNSIAIELAAITLACNKTDVHALDRSDLVALTPQAAAITGLPLVGERDCVGAEDLCVV
jgi:glutamate synthase domain-containing protein 2/glutamate synthase domain-containing protein 3